MKKLVLLFLSIILSNILFAQQDYMISTSLWEGQKWSRNVNQGTWFPVIDPIAHFGIDNYSWGQVRTKTTFPLGTTMQINAQIYLNSGGTNGNLAYFGFGDQWIFYSGKFYGIKFYNGEVLFCEVESFQTEMIRGKIGTYTAGETITFTISLNANGTISASGSKFSGSFTPTTPITSALRFMMTDANNTPDYGFSVSSVTTTSQAIGTISISSFIPNSGPIGTTVTINGKNFDTTPSNNIVYFGAVKAIVTAATSTSLSVIVPIGATYQPISVTVNGLTAYSNAPFIVTFAGGGTISSSSFAPKLDFTIGNHPFHIVVTDLDGDGKSDLAVTNNASNTVSVSRNTSTIGSITFAAKVDFATGSGPNGIAFGDLDGDGKPDLVVANTDNNTISVFRNTSTIGSITFAAKVDFATGPAPCLIAVGDLDGDGKSDLAVTNCNSNTVSVFRNTSTIGSITYTPKVDFVTGGNISSVGVVISDLDGDNKPDLAVTNCGTDTVSMFRNTSTIGSISFAAKVGFATGKIPIDMVVGDLDGDGKPDLAVSYGNIDTVSVFRNTSTIGSITFVTKVDFATGSPLGNTIGDLDGDGKPDLVVANHNGNIVTVFRNTSVTGNISFANKVEFASSGNYGVAIGDLDGDGKPDLAATTDSLNSISVLRNTISEPTNSLIAYYPFNGNANDESGNGNNGTISGATLSTDKFGSENSAYSFNGSSGQITSPNSISLNPTYVTIAGWIYATSGNGTDRGIVCKDDNGANRQYKIMVMYSNKVRARVTTSTGESYIDGTTSVQLNRWYFVAMTYEGTALKLYVDGGLEGSVARTGSINSSPVQLQIGHFGTGTNYFPGTLDDIRIYNRALSESEIESLYHENGWPITTSLVPNSPSNLIASNTGLTSVNLNWVDNSNNENGFKIFRQGDSGIWELVLTTAINSVSCTVSSLQANKTYTFKVTAFNNIGESSASNGVVITTSDLPATPTNLSINVASSSSIRLEWQDISKNELGFSIERSSTGAWTEVRRVASNTQYYIDNGLSAGVTYSYRIRAYNPEGYSGYSSVATATTGSIPNPPSNLVTQTKSTNQIDLNWNDNSSNETSFIVEGRTGSNQWQTLKTLSSNTTTYSHVSLQAGTTYLYRVAACGTYGLSAYSNIASGITGSLPATPSSLSAVAISSTSIILRWTNQANNATGVIIERLISSSWREIQRVDADVTTYTDQALGVGQNYQYRIRAFNNFGQSGPSASVSARTNTDKFSTSVLVKRDGNPVANAIIYVNRQGNGFSATAETGTTNSSGLLVINNLTLGDQIKAVAKVNKRTSAKSGHEDVDGLMYTLYYDNGKMDSEGYYRYDVITESGGTFIVNLTHPFFAFNLVVSVEGNPDEIGNFQKAFQQASDYLYDVTDGQAIFDKIAIYSAKSHWGEADMIVEKTSNYGPNSCIDGILSKKYAVIYNNAMHFGSTWGGRPESDTYSETIVHEFGHYAFGFYDEYLPGNKAYDYVDLIPGDYFYVNYWPYRDANPTLFPDNYGLMDNEHREPTEMSSCSDYNEEYPAYILNTRISRQLDQRKMPCWDWLTERMYKWEPSFIIKQPPYGYFTPGSGIHDYGDREGPGPLDKSLLVHVFKDGKELSPVSFTEVDMIKKEPSMSSINLKFINTDKKSRQLRVFERSSQGISYLGRSEQDIYRSNSPNEVMVYNLNNWKMSMSKSLQGSTLGSTAVLDLSPGVIINTRAELDGQNFMFDVSFESDIVLSTEPTITYSFQGDTGTINLRKLALKQYSGEFIVPLSWLDGSPDGFLETDITDSLGGHVNYISRISVFPFSDTMLTDIQFGALRFAINEGTSKADRLITVTSSFAVPYRSYSQNLLPISEMYSIMIDDLKEFDRQAALSISFNDDNLSGMSKRNIKVYKWDSTAIVWRPLDNCLIDASRNIADVPINSAGVYALFVEKGIRDTIPPSRIEDLGAYPGNSKGEVILSWTASGDDSLSGNAAYYEIRYSTMPITPENWDSAATGFRAASSIQPPKMIDVLMKPSIETSPIYFAIKAFDASGNASSLSNCPSTIPSSRTSNLISILVKDMQSEMAAVFIGMDENGTASYNKDLDIRASLSPQSLVAYSVVDDSIRLLTDFRSAQDTVVHWNIRVSRASSSTDSIAIEWDQTQLPIEGSYILNGVDMRSTNSIQLGKDSSFVIDYYQYGQATSYNRLKSLPPSYRLFQNFPNPFNPSTTIAFELPQRSTVCIEIFDILGRNVERFMYGEQDAGYHEVKFDGRNMASGVYFYRLRAGNFVQTKKLLLLR